MEIENRAFEGESCTYYCRLVVNALRLLSVEEVANYISFNSPTDKHVEFAKHIIDNRYTFYGFKDYMYCYVNIGREGVHNVIDVTCDVAIRMRGMDYSGLVTFVNMFYSITLICIPSTQDRYKWKYFDGRLWYDVDKMCMRRMVEDRIYDTKLLDKFGVEMPDQARFMDRTLPKLFNLDSIPAMLAHDFESLSDDKASVFCMPNCLYDIKRFTVRRQLPGDLCTLCGGTDPLANTLHLRDDMMQVFAQWMSGMDVAESYIDILASSLSEFGPRYAVINSGSGADGKSTLFHIVSRIFGTYCVTMPSTGPSADSKSSNEATPLATYLVKKRVNITTDANDVNRLLRTSGFKGLSGGDTFYIRRLHHEANSENPRLKMLVLINTNQTEFTATSINELTRLRVVRWLNKRITDEDKDIIPTHQAEGSNIATYRYEERFMSMYGGCLMMVLIMRHMDINTRGQGLVLCKKITGWTKQLVAPKTIARFLAACVEKSQPIVQQEVDAATSYALSLQGGTSSDPSVGDLYDKYTAWRKTTGKFSVSDPTNVENFRTHLGFYHRLDKRESKDGTEEEYVKGVRFKDSATLFPLLYGSVRGGMNFMSANMLQGAIMGQPPNVPTQIFY